MEEVDFDEIAHEIWATANLMPGEGIEDGVQRVFDIIISKFKHPPNKKLQTGAIESCTLTCVAPSKDCCDFEKPGCQWPR